MFAIKRGSISGFKLYNNRTYCSDQTNGFLANVICAMESMIIEKARRYARPTIANRAYVRKWYGGKYNHCVWSYCGIELEAKNTTTDETIYIPVVIIADCCESILPSGSATLQVIDETIYFRNAVDVVYAAADFFNTEPYVSDSRAVIEDIPVAFPVPASSEPIPATVGPSFASAASAMTNAFPAHVKRIIIADCISRKDACPISGSDITQENAAVTSCGHVFDAESIKTWLTMASSKQCCPMCKQKCCL